MYEAEAVLDRVCLETTMEESPSDLLILGARYGDMEDVELALAQNVSVDSQDSGGRTGLCYQNIY